MASRKRPETRSARKTGPKRRSRGPAEPKRSVYSFGRGRADGRADMRNTLGGKGANLAEMSRLGVPVPAGFTISTGVCNEFYARGRKIPARVKREALDALAKVERIMEAGFGDVERPLLVSVRSGARVSMPGMMDTVLNLGLNDRTVEGLAEQSGDRRFAFDSYRRFIQMYGDVVLGVDHDLFEQALERMKRERGVEGDTELSVDDLLQLVGEYKAIVSDATGRPFPERPLDQLWGAVAAVFGSWRIPRAETYRRINSIPSDWGTAVNVQAMVFGNLGEDSATGVAFTRDPSTGDPRFFGEYLPQAQGEDVVAGIRTPHAITRADRVPGAPPSMQEVLPDCYRELRRVAESLERHFGEMQDLEFTVQRGKLWMLQTRTGKRTARAAVKIAVDMAREKVIDRRTAVMRVEPSQLDQLLHPMLDAASAPPPAGQGLPASPGAVSGRAVFSAEAAEEAAARGEKVILVRRETSPEDIGGMNAAQGILTALGGMTSHAAVVARGMGKCCIAGCSTLQVDSEGRCGELGGIELKEGDVLTLDGSSGRVYLGEVATVQAPLGNDFRTLMRWADQFRRMRVRANADTPADAEQAVEFGAEGIGLCRTEHMFFQPERLLAVRRMILADSAEERAEALEEILPMQRDDFVGIFRALKGRPVTVRLLDPPLHEFLPQSDAELTRMAAELGVSEAELRRKVAGLHEFNPMLGHRGCRLAITYPEIYEEQARAIAEAACVCAEEGVRTRPEIMVPLTSSAEEMAVLRELIDRTVRDVLRKHRRRIAYQVGTMIEVPRAALVADKLAELSDFFSFGTNDLTQTTMALSRDDSGRFLPEYVERELMPEDPFVSLDISGVGRLVHLAVESGRRARPDLKLGICGEHGGDPRSIQFCEQNGLDYVSCSPFRVPIARLAAAQAAIVEGAV
ncbi:MAG: pyruvate, phosphate dikinase [Proteobacteria bacterium]|nr:pyruvate, phosphate dikinase [Pseudomonadota bacterium]